MEDLIQSPLVVWVQLMTLSEEQSSLYSNKTTSNNLITLSSTVFFTSYSPINSIAQCNKKKVGVLKSINKYLRRVLKRYKIKDRKKKFVKSIAHRADGPFFTYLYKIWILILGPSQLKV